MTPIENALSRLEKVKRRQPGQWSACCPAHDDKGPSLSVRETPDGAVLIHCFAGCTTDEVVGAMGLELTDLFPPRDKHSGAPKKIANLLTTGQALELLANETLLVAVALTNYLHGITLSPQDTERLRLAAGRIGLIHEQSRRHYA
ncbi:MAG: DNA primase [Rhodoferax sp.]|uniref:DNA primase n=1 Tax=Rhodoferax sp. TaxID=50421 RepID=UPI001B6F920C|nr:DNA primase [Rhodoferax sp.]MBP9904871.1 DNA primase [Rhodoferax sp.]